MTPAPAVASGRAAFTTAALIAAATTRVDVAIGIVNPFWRHPYCAGPPPTPRSTIEPRCGNDGESDPSRSHGSGAG